MSERPSQTIRKLYFTLRTLIVKGETQKFLDQYNQCPDKISLHNNTDYRSGVDLLNTAAHVGNAKIVRCLIKHGDDVNRVTYGVAKAFSRAALGNHCEPGGMTPLCYAALGGHLEVVKLLLINKADVNRGQWNGLNPLFYAALGGNLDVVKLLLTYGAKVNQGLINLPYVTPLFFAAQEGHLDVVKLLLDNGADFDTGFSPLLAAAQCGYLRIVKLLIESKGDAKKQFDFCSRLELNRSYINPRCHIHRSGDMTFEVTSKYCDTIKYLILKGADVSDDMVKLRNDILAAVHLNKAQRSVVDYYLEHSNIIKQCFEGAGKSIKTINAQITINAKIAGLEDKYSNKDTLFNRTIDVIIKNKLPYKELSLFFQQKIKQREPDNKTSSCVIS